MLALLADGAIIDGLMGWSRGSAAVAWKSQPNNGGFFICRYFHRHVRDSEWVKQSLEPAGATRSSQRPNLVF